MPVPIPATLVAVSWEFSVRVDSRLDVFESDEANNVARASNSSEVAAKLTLATSQAELPEGVSLNIPILGDLVICAPVVAKEAKEQGKSLAAHYAHLTIHGVLHLLGLNHEDEREAIAMELIERDILAGMGFPDPYTEA